MLTIRDLSYSINDEPILANINLTVDLGSSIGVIGPSGSGKSMLLQAIAGFIKYKGAVSHSQYKKLKNAVQYFNKPSSISNDMTISEMLKLSLREETPFKPINDLLNQSVDNYLSLFDLKNAAQRDLGSLPDSSYKKALLAYHFIKEKPVLLLDNPDAGLDPESLTRLTNVISHYLADGKKIVLTASHNLNFISNLCDRIVLMYGGIISAQGDDKMINSVLLKKFYRQEGISYKNIATGKNEVYSIPAN